MDRNIYIYNNRIMQKKEKKKMSNNFSNDFVGLKQPRCSEKTFQTHATIEGQ